MARAADPGEAQTVAAALARIPALQGLALAGITRLTGGRNSYGAKLGSKALAVGLVGTPVAGGTPAWSATIGLGPLTLSALLPAGANALGDVAINGAIVTVASADHDLAFADLPPDIQRAAAALPGLSPSAHLQLHAGVNLVASIKVSSSGALGEVARQLGIAGDTALLRGTVSAELLRRAAGAAPGPAADGLRGIDLSLALGRIAPPALRGIVESDDLTIHFASGAQSVSASGGAKVHLTVSGRRVEVPTTLTMERAPPDRGSYFRLTGQLPDGALAGVPHSPSLTLGALDLELALVRDGAKRVPFVGVTGHGQIGKAPVTVTAALSRDAAGHAAMKFWADGKVHLADLLPGHAVPGLDHIAVTHIAFEPGQVAASAQLGTKLVTVLAWVPPGKQAHTIAVGAGGISLADFVPAAKGTPLDALSIRAGALFHVPPDNAAKAVPARGLPDLAVQLLGGAQAIPQGGLDLQAGLNLHALVDTRASGALRSLLEPLGAATTTLPLSGTLDPALFTHTPWKRTDGGSAPSGGGARALAQSFLDHLNLRIPLPRITPPGVGTVLSFTGGTLAVTGAQGQVSIAVATTAELKLTSRPIRIEGAISRGPAAGGHIVTRFAAREKTKVAHPFGLKWLELDEVDVAATLDREASKADLEFRARATVARRRYALTAALREDGATGKDLVLSLKGRVPLSAIPGLGSIHGLEKVELVDPEVSRTHVAGEVDILKSQFRVALLERAGHWDMIFQSSGFKLGEILPPVQHTLLGDVAFPRSVMVLSQTGFTRPVRELPRVIQPALAALGLGADGTIHADAGLSMVGAIDPAAVPAGFRKVLTTLGVKAPIVVSGGVGGVLGGTPSLNLQATLPKAPEFPLKALRPRGTNTSGTLRLSFAAGQVTVGVGTSIGFHVGGDDLTFDASLNAALSAENVVLDVQGRLVGAWHRPLRIPGLVLEEVSLTLGVNETSAIVVSVGGKATLGTNTLLVAAGASLLPEALGAPEAVAFLGQVSTLRLDALTGAAENLVAGATGQALPPHHTMPHGGVELHGVVLALMTPGAYIDPKFVQAANLEISGLGMAVAGTLVVDGKRLGAVSGSASDQGVKLSGSLAPFHIGPVKVEKALVDAAVSLHGLPHFTLATRAHVFSDLVDLDIGMDDKGFHFTFDDSPGGHFAASISARTTKGFSLSADNDFELHARLGPDFFGHLRTVVRTELDKIFDELDREITAQERKLADARAALDRAEAKVAAARRAAQRAAKRSVAEARTHVTEAKREVTRLWRAVNAEHAAAQQAARRAHLLAAAEHHAEAARLEADLAGATARERIAENILALVQTGAELPPEADPILLAEVLALEAARALERISAAGLRGAHTIVADLRAVAARLEDPAVFDVAQASIDGSLRTGAGLALDARVFGHPVSLHGSYSVGDLKAIGATIAKAAGSIVSHMRGHKLAEHGPKAPPPPPGQAAAPPPPPLPPAAAEADLSFDGAKYKIPRSACVAAACPIPPRKCEDTLNKVGGPAQKWFAQPRPEGAGACPAPPAGKCDQVVIGARADIDRYQGCPGYRVLDPAEHAAADMDDFVGCALAGRVTGNCPQPLVIGSGWSRIPPTGPSARAICQLRSCGWSVDLHEQGAGSATPTPALIHFGNGAYQIPRSACVAQCPGLPPSCRAEDWTNQAPTLGGPRVSSKGNALEACPAPPRGSDGRECTQVVLGRIPDVEVYKGCPGYVVLNRSDWTMETNDAFVACAAQRKLGTCPTPILVRSGWNSIPTSSVTAREMCQLSTCGWNLTLHASTPGTAMPPGAGTAAPAAGPSDQAPFAMRVSGFTVTGGAQAGQPLQITMTVATSGGSGTRAVPWKIVLGSKVLKEGVEQVTAGAPATRTISATAPAPAGTYDIHGEIDPANTLGAPRAQLADHVSERVLKVVADWPGWLAAARQGMKRGFPDWIKTLRITGVAVVGPVASGGVVAVTPLAPHITGPMLAAGVPPEMVGHFAGAVSEVWEQWARGLRVPDLPWYPTFQAWPEAYAPPTPNVPTPLASLASTAPIQPGVLLAALRTRMGDAATSAEASLAILDFGSWLTEPLEGWGAGVLITMVMGQGPAPSVPAVPAGPVIGTAEGLLFAAAPTPNWK